MSTYAITTQNRAYYPTGVNVATVDGGAYPANQGPYLNYYRGKGARPWGRGRPLLIRIVGGGYNGSSKTGAALDSDANADYDTAVGGDYRRRLLWHWLEAGGSAIEASISIADTSNPYAKYVSNGKTTAGLIMPPGFVPSGAGFAPFGDPDCPNWYTDAIHAIQHAVHYHADFEGDPENVWGFGDSASAHALDYAVYQEWAHRLGSVGTDPQYGASTRMRGVFLDRTLVRWDGYTTTLAMNGFPKGSTLASGDYTTPVATVADLPTAAQVGTEFRNAFSLLGTGSYGVEARIRSTACFLTTGASAASTDQLVSAGNQAIIDPPFVGLATSEPLHTSWSGMVLRKYVNDAPVKFLVAHTATAGTVSNEDGAYGTDATTSTQKGQELCDNHWQPWLKSYAFAPPAPRVRPMRGARGHSSRLVSWTAAA